MISAVTKGEAMSPKIEAKQDDATVIDVIALTSELMSELSGLLCPSVEGFSDLLIDPLPKQFEQVTQ